MEEKIFEETEENDRNIIEIEEEEEEEEIKLVEKKLEQTNPVEKKSLIPEMKQQETFKPIVIPPQNFIPKILSKNETSLTLPKYQMSNNHQSAMTRIPTSIMALPMSINITKPVAVLPINQIPIGFSKLHTYQDTTPSSFMSLTSLQSPIARTSQLPSNYSRFPQMKRQDEFKLPPLQQIENSRLAPINLTDDDDDVVEVKETVEEKEGENEIDLDFLKQLQEKETKKKKPSTFSPFSLENILSDD